MPLLLMFLKNSWKQIIIGLVIFGAVYTGYNWVWDRGYNTAGAEYREVLQEQADARAKQIEELTGYAKTNLEQSLVSNEKLQRDLAEIKRNAKGKPTTVVVDKDCVPSPDFIQTYNKAIDKGNGK
jgi:hypothetical protein